MLLHPLMLLLESIIHFVKGLWCQSKLFDPQSWAERLNTNFMKASKHKLLPVALLLSAFILETKQSYWYCWEEVRVLFIVSHIREAFQFFLWCCSTVIVVRHKLLDKNRKKVLRCLLLYITEPYLSNILTREVLQLLHWSKSDSKRWLILRKMGGIGSIKSR